MKIRSLLPALALFAGLQAAAQTDAASEDSLGLPGDHFDLYGALDLFKTATSLEDFEKKLNDETNHVNNLDLDEDGNVDYIRVVDNREADAHAIQLQVAVSETESQDVAAIEIEKTGDASADLQIVGDEELYGENYIVEPSEETTTTTPDQKFRGFRPALVVVNVWLWPSVRYIYAPAYVVWVSPWHYRVYPVWWHPWHPVPWRVHYGHVRRYHHPYYHCVHAHRMHNAHMVYSSHRAASGSVHRRNEAAHQRHTAARSTNAGGKQQAAPRGGKQQSAPRAGKQSGGTKTSASPRGNGGQGKNQAAPRSGGAKPKGGGGAKPRGGGGRSR